MKAIETFDLTKVYDGKIAVDSLNLSIDQGELFALLGINGAGKTTTIKMLSCLITPTKGDARILGDSVVSNSQSVKKKISLSPQEDSVAPNLTVKENLELIARIYGFEKREARIKTEKMIDLFNLEEVATSKSKTLSGGMKRRLSIAMALIPDPQVLFLDEPTLGVDVIARRELWNIIKKLKGRITMILTIHYMEEAESLADKIGIIVKGKLKAEGTAAQLMQLAGAQKFEDAFVKLATEEGAA
ncbi:ABC transporter ATP-binding protein [Pseudothermotoga elfii]